MRNCNHCVFIAIIFINQVQLEAGLHTHSGTTAVPHPPQACSPCLLPALLQLLYGRLCSSRGSGSSGGACGAPASPASKLTNVCWLLLLLLLSTCHWAAAFIFRVNHHRLPQASAAPPSGVLQWLTVLRELYSTSSRHCRTRAALSPVGAVAGAVSILSCMARW